MRTKSVVLEEWELYGFVHRLVMLGNGDLLVQFYGDAEWVTCTFEGHLPYFGKEAR